MDRNGFIYFNTRLSPKNSGKADSYAWAIMILDEVLPYQDVTDLKENGNQPAEISDVTPKEEQQRQLNHI
jgi:putative restriction endonuclease